MEISLIFLRVYCFANEVISAIGCVLRLILLKKQRGNSENCSFAQEFALDLSNKLQDNFFKSFFLVLILLLSFNVTQGVLSLLRNGCFLSAVTWMFVQYCQSSARRNAVGDSRKIFHDDKVTLHGLNNVYDRFSLAREKL